MGTTREFEQLKNKSNAGVRHNPKAVGRPRKIGVEKGHGPRHAANSREGDEVSTDTVPAMLTPREAVLNRNAAELAGRGNIEALNQEGNQLAKRGVDLASGESNMKEKTKKMQEGGYVQGGPQKLKNPRYSSDANQPALGGGMPPGYLGPPDQVAPWQPPKHAVGSAEWIAGHPQFHQNFFKNPNTGAWQPRAQQDQVPGLASATGQTPGMGGWYGQQPQPALGGMMTDANQPALGGGGFYPPNQGPLAGKKPLYGQSGISDLSGPAINEGFGPPPQLSAPDISGLLQKAGKEQGLSTAQINGLMNAFKGAGQAFSGGGYGEGSATSQALGPALEQAFPGGYQGGISDIGYPPFVAPQADYHGDKGGWQGRYDPNYFIPNYG